MEDQQEQYSIVEYAESFVTEDGAERGSTHSHISFRCLYFFVSLGNTYPVERGEQSGVGPM